MKDMSVQVCPGCGGRNTPQAESCDWCGRSFSERQRSFSVRWWQLAGALVIASIVAAVVGLAFLNASRPDTRARAGSLDGAPTQQPVQAPAATARPTDAADIASTRTTTAVTPTVGRRTAPSPTPPTPVPTRYVRVANTGGIGVNLRKDPGPQGQPIIAVADNTLLRLVGPEETVQARLWRLCEHEARGAQGWVPAEYLQPSDQVPTPGRT